MEEEFVEVGAKPSALPPLPPVPPSAAPDLPAPPPGPPPPPAAPQSYYPPYGYPAPYYVYPYSAPQAPRPLEPRQLRTVQAFDTAVFTCYLLGASFAWSALVAMISIAALGPTLTGDPRLGPTERGWLEGVMIARVIVWLMFAFSALLGLTAFLKFHEGRAEFGPNHERRYREFQALLAVFGALVGGAGLFTFIISNPPNFGFPPQDQVTYLTSLKSSILLSALVWGAACAVSGFLLAGGLSRLVRPFISEEHKKPLNVIPVIFLFVPLIHAALAAAFVGLADVATGTWTDNALHAVAESGGLAGIAAAVPLVLLIRALREAQDRVLSGEVKPDATRRTV